VFHPHQIFARTVFIELENVHTEPGVFVDSEHGLATALLIGRCRLCGVVYMPLVPIPPRNEFTPPILTSTSSSQQSIRRDGHVRN
jgi:hypothetical protein